MAQRWHYEYTVVLINWFIWGFVALDRLLITYLFPMILPDLKMDFTQAGLIMSILGICWGVMAIFGGGMSDKFGRRTIIIPATIIFSLMSWATGLAKNLFQLSLVRGIMGCAEGAYYPTGIATIGEESNPMRRGLMIGLFQTAWPVWGGFLGAIYATQVGSVYGWRWVFYLTIIPGLIIALLHSLFIREPKSVADRIEARKKGLDHKIISETGEHVTVRSVLKFRNIILCILMSICFMTWSFQLLSFGTLYLTKVQNLQITAAGFVMSAWGVGGLFGMFAIPAISDRIGRKIAVIISALLAGLTMLWFAYAGGNPGLLYFIMLLVGFFGYGAYPVWLAVIPSETVPFGLAGLAVGLPTGIGEVIGGGVFPTIGGMMADAFGLGSTMVLAGIALLVATVLACFLIETAPKKRKIKMQGSICQ